VLLLREVADADQISNVARKILAAVVKPATINGQECRVTASIGASLFPSDAKDARPCIGRCTADRNCRSHQAMRQQERCGRTHRLRAHAAEASQRRQARPTGTLG
jgi:GGDEF domain-containing protein